MIFHDLGLRRRRGGYPSSRACTDFLNMVLNAAGRPEVANSTTDALFDELLESHPVRDQYELHRGDLNELLRPKSFQPWRQRLQREPVARASFLIYYALVRLLKPDNVVETGVASGGSSAWILQALEQNGSGQLTSIDLPPKAEMASMSWTMPDHLANGFLVPQDLRERWTLIEGDALFELPPVLRACRPNIFIHDSDHSWNQMVAEYSMAHKWLSKPGVVISDDTRWNTAWKDFCTANQLLAIAVPGNPQLGVTLLP